MEDDWQVACTSLQKFTGLKTLRINIEIEGFHTLRSPHLRWRNFEKSPWAKRILKPLEPLSASEEFVVKYTWPASACSQWPKGKFRMVHQSGYC